MATDLPQEQRVEAVRLLQAARPLDDMSEEFMAAWKELLQGARDEDISRGNMGKLRESILTKVCTSLKAQAFSSLEDEQLGQGI